MGTRFAVIGAGAAGLMAALDLRAAGHRPTVFEARDRVGGRIHTVRFPDGRWANAGAEWLNSTDTIANHLVEKYRLPLVERFGFEALVVDGEPILEETTSRIHEKLDAQVATLQDLEHPWDDGQARALDRMSVAEWAYQLGAEPAELRQFFTDMAGEYMAPVTELSLAAVALSAATTSNDRATRLAHGTAALPEAMAYDLGEDTIRLSEPVHAITHDDDGVTITTTIDRYRFDAVILTVPLPVLARIQLTPAIELPWIAQGRGGKLLVPYQNKAWENRRPAISRPDAGMEFVYESASHQERGGILTAYSTGELDDTQVRSAFASWYPELDPSPAPALAAWWHLDPYAGTTYSAPQPGYLDALRSLRQPRGRVFFAGEHTEILFGFIESALNSGRRAATQLNSARW